MQKSFLKNFISLFFILTFLVPSVVPIFAQNNIPAWIPCNGVNDPNAPASSYNRACTFADIITAAKAVANEVVQIGLLLLPVILAYVGYLFITSSDNPGKRNDAKKIGWNVLKGVIYMMLAWVVVNFILTALVNPAVFTNTGVFKI